MTKHKLVEIDAIAETAGGMLKSVTFIKVDGVKQDEDLEGLDAEEVDEVFLEARTFFGVLNEHCFQVKRARMFVKVAGK